MSVTLTVDIPASNFDVGRVIEAIDGVHVEVRTVVPLGDQAMPVFEIENREHDHEEFIDRLEDHSAVASVVTIDQYDERGSYAVEWSGEIDSFYHALSDHDAIVLSATKEDDRWTFDLQFPSREAVTGFQEQIHQEEIDLAVHRVIESRRSTPDPEDALSPAQREALDLALSEGYYSIPRRTTTAEMGEQLGISDQAVVERLRRAMVTLSREYVAASRGRGRSTN